MKYRDGLALNGLRNWSRGGKPIITYVYPGSIDIEIGAGIRLQTRNESKFIELGTFLGEPSADTWMNDAHWTWQEGAAERRAQVWVKHVMVATLLQRPQGYEYEGELVLVGTTLPSRQVELLLLQAGFRPSLATWRAKVTEERRKRLPEFIAWLGGGQPAGSPLATPMPVDPKVATKDLKDRAQHVWMRWYALFEDELVTAGRTYQVKGRPTLGEHAFVIRLRHPSSGSDLAFHFDVLAHPLLYKATAVFGNQKLERQNLTWEDFPEFVDAVGTAIKPKKTASERGEASTALVKEEREAAKPSAGDREQILEAHRNLRNQFVNGEFEFGEYQRRLDALSPGALAAGLTREEMEKLGIPFYSREEINQATKATSTSAAPTKRSRRASGRDKGRKNELRTPSMGALQAGWIAAIDAFNAGPRWRLSRRQGASVDTLVVFDEQESEDTPVALFEVVGFDIDQERWIRSVGPLAEGEIRGRLERALWVASDIETASKEPRSPLEDLIAHMTTRGLNLGAASIGELAEARKALANPPSPDILIQWLRSADLSSTAESISDLFSREGDVASSLLSVESKLARVWDSIDEELTILSAEAHDGALWVPDAAVHGVAQVGRGALVLEYSFSSPTRYGPSVIEIPVRLEQSETDEDATGGARWAVSERTGHLKPGARLYADDRTPAFYAELHKRLHLLEDDLTRAPRFLFDVRELLYWSAAFIDAPRCQAQTKRAAQVAVQSAISQYNRACLDLAKGATLDRAAPIREELRKLSEAAAGLALSCGEGQLELDESAHKPERAYAPSTNPAPSMSTRSVETSTRPTAMMGHRQAIPGWLPTAMAGPGRPRRPAAQKPTHRRVDWDAIAAESERRVLEKEGELVATMDRLTRIYSGGRLAGRRVRPGTIVIERVSGSPEFPSLVLPNLASIADGFDVGAAVAIVGLMPLEFSLAGWVDPGDRPTSDGDRLTAALEASMAAYHAGRTSQEEFEVTRNALWDEAERAGVAVEMAWRLYTKWGKPPMPREPAVATSLPSIPVRGMPHLRYFLELYLRQIPSDAHASVISRWVRPPHDHIEAGQGAWQRVLELLLDHSTCSQCPFVLGSNLDCETCRAWVLSLKRPGAAWTAERIGAAIYNCDEPAVATAAVEALAQSTQEPLTAAFFREFAENFEVRLTKDLKGPDDMDPGYRDHCRQAVEWLLPQPDFPLPEYPPSKGEFQADGKGTAPRPQRGGGARRIRQQMEKIVDSPIPDPIARAREALIRAGVPAELRVVRRFGECRIANAITRNTACKALRDAGISVSLIRDRILFPLRQP